MVAVISGNGLGLLQGSLSQLGQDASGAGLGLSRDRQYVNVANGNLVLQGQDAGLDFDGLSIADLRTYNSLGVGKDQGWLWGFSRNVRPDTDSTVVREGDDGSLVTYVYDAATGLYVSTDANGPQDTLQRLTGHTAGWLWTDGATHREEMYDGSGLLTSIFDPRTSARYTLTYSHGQLASIAAGDGDVLSFQYGKYGLLARVDITELPPGASVAQTRTLVTYAYDDAQRLVQVSTALASDSQASAALFTTRYTYEGDSLRISDLVQSDGVVVHYTYVERSPGEYGVASVTTGVGNAARTVRFAYGRSASDAAWNTTQVSDGAGQVWTYTSDARGDLLSLVSPAVGGQRPVTSYTYDGAGNVLRSTDGLGNTTVYIYDAYGNPIAERDAAGNTITRTFDAHHYLLTQTLYRATSAGDLAQGANRDTTRYVYDDAGRLRFVIDATGAVTERAYDANGLLCTLRHYLGTTYRIDALDDDESPTLKSMGTWAAQQDLGRTTRADFAYDLRGLLATQTDWATVDGRGAGVRDAATAVTRFVYDAQGLLRQQAVVRGSGPAELTSYTYDGMGRPIGRTSASGAQTTWVYGGDGSVTSVTIDTSAASQPGTTRVTTERRNASGEVVAVTISDSAGSTAHVTENIYDVDGRLCAVRAPDGAIDYTFYDAAGRVSAQVDATGAVTEYRHDADGRVTGTIAYATRVDTRGWLVDGVVVAQGIDAIRPTASADDRVSITAYDAAGRVATQTDASGTATRYEYDGESHLVRTTVRSADGSESRVTRYFYDADGRRIATLDAAGDLTEFVYDEAGRLVREIAYATATDPARRTDGMLAQLRPATSADDHVTRHYYDGRGNEVATLDAAGYVTRYAYDEATHQRTTTRFAQTVALGSNPSLAEVLAAVAGQASQTSTCRYDADGRKVAETNAEGTLTTYTYDGFGRLVRTVQAQGTEDSRTTQAVYDAFGNLLSQTDGNGKVTTYTYDAQGRQLSVTDSLGQTTWSVYDADGRVRFRVRGMADAGDANAQGEVVEYRYDAFGELSQTVTYASRLALPAGFAPTEDGLTQAASALADAVHDGNDIFRYDAAGRLVEHVDGDGYLTRYGYDAFGDRTSETLPLDGTHSTVDTYVYDALGRRTDSIEDVGGVRRATSATYDALGRLSSSTDGRGVVTLYGYDRLDRETARSISVDGTARVARTQYDAYGRVLVRTDALGNSTRYAYDEASRTVTVTTPEGVTLATAHNREGQTIAVTDAAGNSIRYSYDADGHLLRTDHADGTVEQADYDAGGRLIHATDGAGRSVVYAYDAAGRVLSQTVDPDGLALVTRYAYDGRGQRVAVTAPDGTVTTYAYDADGNVLAQVEDAGDAAHLNLTTTYTWDARGRQLSITRGSGTPEASTTRYVYDALGRQTAQVVADGALNLITRYDYDAQGNLVRVTDPAGANTYYAYDEAGERTYTLAPTGAPGQGTLTHTTYDADGRITSVTGYAAVADTAADALPTATPSEARAILTGIAARIADAQADRTVYRVYDRDGHLRFALDGAGAVIENRYDALGQLAATLTYAGFHAVPTDLAAAIQRGAADADTVAGWLAGQGVSETGAGVTRYYYDSEGRVRFSVVLAQVGEAVQGVVSEKRYDGAGKTIATIQHGATLSPAALAGATTDSIAAQLAGDGVARTTRFLYDQVGRQRAVIGPDGATQFTFYDAAGRITATVDAGGSVVGFEYDAAGRMMSRTAFATTVSTDGWIVGDRVVPVARVLPPARPTGAPGTGGATGNHDRVIRYAYDTLGRLVEQRQVVDSASGVDTSGGTAQPAWDERVISYRYDAASRQVAVSWASALSGDVRTAYYLYDADGRRTAELDASGHLTETVYDTAGHVARTIAYAQAVALPSGTDPAACTLAQLRPQVNADDRTTRYYYDGLGQRIGELDAQGYLTVYGYDGAGRVTTQTRYADTLAGHEDESFEALHTLAAQGAQRQSQRRYDAQGRLAEEVSEEGSRTDYTYDANGWLLCTDVAAGTADSRITGQRFDAFGEVVASTDGNNHTSTATYDAAGRRTSVTDPLGNRVWFVYDRRGELTFMVRGIEDAAGHPNALGEVTRTEHDAFGEVVRTVTYARRLALSTDPAFDEAGLSAQLAQLAQPYAAAGSSSYDVAATYSYDSTGDLIARTDGNAHLTAYAYDVFGEKTREVSLLDDAGQRLSVSTYAYDATGHLTEERQGVVAGSALDPAVVALQSGLPNPMQVVHRAYDAFGDLSAVTDAGGVRTSYSYDHLGNQIAQALTVQGTERRQSFVYDAFGRELTHTDALGRVSRYAYDDAARSFTVTSPDGVAVTTTHNREGQTVAVTDGAGHATTYRYDGAGQLVETVDATGARQSRSYDDAGHLYQTTDADGRVIRYAYDAAGRVLSQTVDPAGAALITRYAYDGAGRQLSVTDPAGVVTTYAYDGQGNLLAQVQDAGDGTHLNLLTRYTWDAQGHKLSVTYGRDAEARTTTYAYDGLGRLLSETDGANHQRSYSYDANGNAIRLIDANGKATYYVYNEANEKVFTIQPLGGDSTTCAVSQNFYDADGNLVASRAYARPVNLSSVQQSTEGGFTLVGVAAAAMAVRSDADLQNFRIYDDDGRECFTVEAGGRVTETRYNPLGQVSQTLAYAQPIAIDEALAARLQAGSADAPAIQDKLVAVGDTEASARRTYSYYDAAGRVRFQLLPGKVDGASGGIVTEMRYDAAGHIIATLNYGSLLDTNAYGNGVSTDDIAGALAGQPFQRTRSVYDGAGRLVYTIDADGHVREQRYDAASRPTLTLVYAHPASISEVPTLAEVAAAVTAANPQPDDVRGSGQVYDEAGRVTATFDSLGAPATTTRYDSAGLKIATTDRDGDTTTYQYNAQGLVSDEIGPQIDVAVYDSYGAYAGTTKTQVRTHYEHDNEGRLLSRVQAQSDGTLSVSYTYDARGNQTGTALQGDRNLPGSSFATSTQVVYNALNQAVASRDVRGFYSYKLYDDAGRVAYEVGADGYVTHYEYDAYGNQTRVTRYAQGLNFGALQQAGWKQGTEISADLLQRGLSTSPDDRTLTTVYDERGNKLSVTQTAVPYVRADGSLDVGSPTTRYTYDAYGNFTSESVLVENADGRAPAVWATTYHYYDAEGRQTEAVDPMGYVTTWTYDGFGNVASVTEWACAIPTAGLRAGGPAPATPAAGDASSGFDRITRYTWDEANRKATEATRRYAAQADGTQALQWVTTSYTYDGEGRVTLVDVDGKRVTTQYDAMGRIVRITGPGERVLRDNWQALLAAHPTWTLDPSNDGLYITAAETVSYVYDSFGEKVVETHGSTGSSLKQSSYTRYDGGGRAIASVAMPTGTPDWSSSYARQMSYDAAGNLLTVVSHLTDLDGNTVQVTTTNVYDADGRPTGSVTRRAGESTPDTASAARYNAFGEQTGSGVLSADEQTVTYDAAGRRSGATDPATGVVHTYGYNLAGQLVLDSHPLATSVGGSVWTRYVLDLDGRVSGEVAPSSQATAGEGDHTLSASYDRWGNVLSSTDFNGNTTTYLYNDRNQVVQETGAAVDVTDQHGVTRHTPTVKSTVYDLDGNVIASTDENGYTTQATHDALGRVVSLVDGAAAVHRTAFDALGREVADEDGIGHITFKNLDALGRTVQQGDFVPSGSGRRAAWQQAFVLDENGNRLVAYDGIGSALLQQGNTSEAAKHANYYGYDSQGRILWSQDPAQRAASEGASAPPPSGVQVDMSPINANFEQGDVGWDKGDGWEIYEQPGHTVDGTWVAGYHGVGPQSLTNKNRVPVEAGQSITASAQVSLYLAPDGAAAAGAVLIVWYDANGNMLSWSEGNVVDDDHLGAFRQSSVTATAPSGAAYAAVAVSGWANGIGALSVDDVRWSYSYVPPLDVDTGPDIRVPAAGGPIRTTYAYDAYGHKTGETNADGDSQSWTYDAYGRLTAHTDLSGAHYHYDYDTSSGQLIQTSDDWSAQSQGQTQPPPYVIGSDANSATRSYYANGQLATLRYADGSHDAYFYDDNGNLIRKETYAVDGNGKPVRTVTAMTYDSHNRLVHVTETRTDGGTREASQVAPQLKPYLLPVDGDGGGGGGGGGGSTYDPVPDSWPVTTSTMNLTYRYDAVGNRRAVTASESSGSGSSLSPQLVPIDWDGGGGGGSTGGGTGSDGSPAPASASSEAWYTYDGDNRVVISAGKLVNGDISLSTGAASYALSYDGAGNTIVRTTVNAAGHTLVLRSHFDLRSELVQADYAVDLNAAGATRGIAEKRVYDENGRVLAIEQFYALGTRIDARLPPKKYTPDDDLDGNFDTGELVGGKLSTATVDQYDVAGHLIEEQNFGHPNSWDGTGADVMPPDLPDANALTWGGMSLQNRVVYRGPEGQAGYDAMGHVLAYQYRDAVGRVDAYTVSYLKKDDYLEKATAGVNITGTANVRPATDQSVYDNRGDRIAIAQQVQYQDGAVADMVRVFAYDGSGQIITRRDGTADGSAIDSGTDPGHAQQHFVYANGQQVASYDEGGTLNVLDQVTAFSNTDRGTGGYVVQAGDSLKSIAQAIYGNSSLWYVIADANALSGDADLVLGQTLQLPQVTTHANDSTTFKPYSPAEIEGSTTPTLPVIAPPPPPPSHHCNAIATIIVVAVIVVATIFTAGAAAAAMGVTVEGATTTMALGGAVLAGGAGVSAAVLGAAFVGGVVGNIAGQVVGDALGVHHGFSLREAFASGVTTAVTAGIGGELAQTSTFGEVVNGVKEVNTAGQYLLGAGAYAAQTVGQSAAGLHTQFSWAGVVASGLAAGLTAQSGVGRWGGSGQTSTTYAGSSAGAGSLTAFGSSGTFEGDLASGLLSGAIKREASIALGDDRVASWDAIGEDAFGNALGNAVKRELNSISAQRQRQQLEAIEKRQQTATASTEAKLSADIERSAKEHVQADMDRLLEKPDVLMGDQVGAATSGRPNTAANAQSPAGYGNVSATGDHQGSGFPIIRSDENFDPSNSSDMAKLQQEHDNIVKYVNYANDKAGSKLYGTPPDASDWKGLIGYGEELSREVWAKKNTVTVTATVPSALQEDTQITEASRQASAEFFDQFRGSFLGDLGANAGTLLTDGGNGLIGAGKALRDIVTDYESFRQVAIGTTLAVAHPIDAYNRAVDAASDWMGRPLDEQMRDVGDFGMSILTVGGAEAGAVKATGYAAKAASYAGDLVSTMRSAARLDMDGAWLEAPQGEAAGFFGSEVSEPGAGSFLGESSTGEVLATQERLRAQAFEAIETEETAGAALVPEGAPLSEVAQDGLAPDTVNLGVIGLRTLEPEYVSGVSEADILSTPKGERPDPSTYLTQSYQDAHAALFRDGAVRIQPSAPSITVGVTETWVFPKSLADDAIANAAGDVRALEKTLGLDEGYLGASPVRVDIPNPRGYRIPTGNEFGAHPIFWRPGGITWPGGLPEAVIDPVPVGSYVTNPVFGG